MWVYFSKNGRVRKQLEHGMPARQGTVGFKIVAVFDGDYVYPGNEATIQFADPNGVTLETIYRMDYENEIEFDPQPGEQGFYPFAGGEYYQAYSFTCNDSAIFSQSGLYTATIRIYKNNEVVVSGLLSIEVETAVMIDEVVLSQSNYDELVSMISSKIDEGELDYYVTLATDQVITGNKTFTNGITAMNSITLNGPVVTNDSLTANGNTVLNKNLTIINDSNSNNITSFVPFYQKNSINIGLENGKDIVITNSSNLNNLITLTAMNQAGKYGNLVIGSLDVTAPNSDFYMSTLTAVSGVHAGDIYVNTIRPSTTLSVLGNINMNGYDLASKSIVNSSSITTQSIVANWVRTGDLRHEGGRTYYFPDDSDVHPKNQRLITEQDLDDKFASVSPEYVLITWAELKAIKDAGELVPGTQYRITDYEFTTVTTNTSSAGHVFDIIVIADDESHLNEKARACLHDGDTYFASSNLAAWQLWYCIDNDTNRFAWADSTNGKGVIYRMIDEFENDIPYDFKNCLFTKDGVYTDAYTLNAGFDDDASITKSKYCYSNKMNKYESSNVQQLNFNVFYSAMYCHNNTFGNNCCNNVFEHYCYSNVFAEQCHDNTFGERCCSNMFGGYYSNNTAGDFFCRNVFGENCSQNTFDQNCSQNKFGNHCINLTFGSSCNGNTLKDDCSNITLGQSNMNNIFWNHCGNISFGQSCEKNEIKALCLNISLGRGNSENKIEAGCSYITFAGILSSNNVVESGCRYLNCQTRKTKVRIHTGVAGSSSTNMLNITEAGNFFYSTDIYAANSKEIILDE